jgi:hypothetical protein
MVRDCRRLYKEDLYDLYCLLYKEDLYDLYCSPSVIPVTKSRRIKWAGHVERMGERRSVCIEC